MHKVLIIDDEKDICFLISEILKDEKYITYSALNSNEAISYFNKFNPDLIILDEPLHGCDPIARTSIMNVIRELGSQGKTVLVSSHILEEIERITEQIVILHNGRLLALGNLHAIRGLLDKHPHRIMLTTDEPRKLASAFIGEKPIYGVRFPEDGKLEIQTNNLSKAHSVLPRVIVESKITVTSIDNPDDNLESLLGYLVGGDT